jgi:hypothetical protein
VGVYCTECANGFTIDALTGDCPACPANCLTCQDDDDYSDVVCTECAVGYTLGGPSNNFACTATVAALQDGQGQPGAGMDSLTVGLIAWGCAMTVAAAVLLVLWVRRGKSEEVKTGLLGSEIEVGRMRT